MGSQKIRVEYLIGQLGMGGSERQLYLLLKNFDRTRFELRVVVFNDSPYTTHQQGLEEAGVEVVHVPSSHRTVLSRARWLLDELRRTRPDVVHSWTVHDNPYAGIVGAAARVPVRWGSLRGSIHLAGFRSLPLPLRMLALRSVSKLVVNSEAIRYELEETGFPASKLIVLTNCVQPAPGEGLAVDLSSHGIESHHRLVGIVGNLRPVKNHLMFVRAMAPVLARHAEVRAVIVGQSIASAPGVEEELRGVIDDLGLAGRVALLGFRSDVAALMRRFEIVCLTSSSEGMPNVILEAMAAAVPVVATKVGGVPELVEDGVSGFLVPIEEEEAFVARILEILNTEELASRLGKAGKEKVEQLHQCDRVVRFLEDHYLTARRAGRTVPNAGGPEGRRR